MLGLLFDTAIVLVVVIIVVVVNNVVGVGEFVDCSCVGGVDVGTAEVKICHEFNYINTH